VPELIEGTVRDSSHFEAVVRVGVGPVRGRFTFKFELQPDPATRRMQMRISGGGFGSAVDMTAVSDVVAAPDETRGHIVKAFVVLKPGQAPSEALAAELVPCGIRLDLAPVVDVDTNPKNPVIGDRSFGDDPELVGRLAAAQLEPDGPVEPGDLGLHAAFEGSDGQTIEATGNH